MTQLLPILEFLLPALYAAVFALYFRNFLNPESSDSFFGPPTLKLTVVVHIGYLVVLGIATDHFPIAAGTEFMSVLAAAIGVIYILVEWRQTETNTGVFFIGLIFLFQLASSVLMQHVSDVPMRSREAVYSIHVIFTLMGFAALSIGALYAFMYVLLSRQLKSRELGLIFRRLPSLATLENMSKTATVAGIVVLGLGLALGHYFALGQAGSFNIFDPIIISADLIWLTYLIGLIVVTVRGLSGLRIGYLSLIGYVVLMSSMVAIVTIFGEFHSF
jgi:ABC-type transport system involved in cytochrome c biogenesis permease subunit